MFLKMGGALWGCPAGHMRRRGSTLHHRQATRHPPPAGVQGVCACMLACACTTIASAPPTLMHSPWAAANHRFLSFWQALVPENETFGETPWARADGGTDVLPRCHAQPHMGCVLAQNLWAQQQQQPGTSCHAASHGCCGFLLWNQAAHTTL